MAIIDNETLNKFLSSDMFADMFRDGLEKFISADRCVEILNNGYKKIHDWLQVQEWVRDGTILNHFKIGDILLVNYWGNPIPFVFSAYNIAKSAVSEYKNTMTLVSLNILGNMIFDAAEKWYPSGDRSDFGNSRYAVSAIRQWLNSERCDGKWWGKRHDWDESPGADWEKNPGFMYGFDTLFMYAIGKTEVTVKRPPCDGGGYDILNDEYFYLLSRDEIGEGDGQIYPAFSNCDLLRKKGINGGDCGEWSLRDYCSSSRVCAVNRDGRVSYRHAHCSSGVVVACNII